MEKQALKRRLPSVIRWILWVLLVQFILINISASLYAYKLTHLYKSVSVNDHASGKNIFIKTWKLFTGPNQPKLEITEKPVFPFDTVLLKTAKGLNIDTWFAKTDSISKGTVIMFHGITVNKAVLLDEAFEFLKWGYNILLVDFRAHGNSGGSTTTIGLRETEEVKLAWDYMQQQGEKTIFLYGSSMGAVAIAKSIADYQLKPAGIILEMPFQNLQTYLKARARMLGFPQQPFAFLTTFWIGVERGFNGFNFKTTRYVKEINCPVLMQCGGLDPFVLMKESEIIYSAIASTQKKLVVYDRAQHESFLRRDPIKWRIETERFLSNNTH